MMQTLSKLPETLTLPEQWDYDEAVKVLRPIVYTWKCLTVDMLYKLWVAREKLRNQGNRTDLTSGKNSRSWEQFCLDVGLNKRTVNNWLSQFNPEIYLILKNGGVDFEKLDKSICNGEVIHLPADIDPCPPDPEWELFGVFSDITNSIGIDPDWIYRNYDTPTEFFQEYPKDVTRWGKKLNGRQLKHCNAIEKEWLEFKEKNLPKMELELKKLESKPAPKLLQSGVF